MTYTRPDIIHDAGKVNTDGARLAGCQRGTPARTGAGAYTYTFQAGSAIDAGDSATIATCNTTVLDVSVVHTSDTVLTVATFDAAAAATDSVWSFVVLNLAF